MRLNVYSMCDCLSVTYQLTQGLYACVEHKISNKRGSEMFIRRVCARRYKYDATRDLKLMIRVAVKFTSTVNDMMEIIMHVTQRRMTPVKTSIINNNNNNACNIGFT